MSIHRYDGIIKARTAIHHGGNEKTGSSPILRTIFLFVEGQGEVPFPYVSGNAIRGKLRRLLMRDFLDQIGLDPETLTPKVYHLLFTGGILESTEETYAVIDIEGRRRLRSLFPPLALLGAAWANQMIPGKLKVGNAFPFCLEYKQYLPPKFAANERAVKSVRIFTDETFNTRRDDLQAKRKEDEQAHQMKIDYECFIPGTWFYHWFVLEFPTEIDLACFGRFIELFQASPFIGGKLSSGNGEVELDYQPDFPLALPYLDFCQTKKDEIKALIGELK